MFQMPITMNILSNIAIMALPLGMLRTLHVNRLERLGLAFIFLIATVEVALDIARVFMANWISNDFLTISSVEPPMALILCALPVYRSAFKRQARALRERLALVGLLRRPSSEHLRALEDDRCEDNQHAAHVDYVTLPMVPEACVCTKSRSCGNMEATRPGVPLLPPVHVSTKISWV